MLLIKEKQFAEELRAMEIGVVCVYGVPREIVLLLRQIAAFVEIPPDRPGRNEFREKQPQQLEGQLGRAEGSASGPPCPCRSQSRDRDLGSAQYSDTARHAPRR